MLYITILSPQDDLGRNEYLVQWWANNIGVHLNQTGWRGQIGKSVIADTFRNRKFKIISDPKQPIKS